jgi:hypothetical protein
VDKTLKQSLKKDNIKSRFRVSWIWPLNHVAMVGKFIPSDMFTSVEEEDHKNSYYSNPTNESSNNGNEVKTTMQSC